MKKLLRMLVILPAILFVVMGLRWVTDPAGAADALGMTLLEGLGRSSQIGDVGTLFPTMGLMILIGLVTNGVLPVPDGYNQVHQAGLNGLRDRFGKHILLALLTCLTILPFLVVDRYVRRSAGISGNGGRAG